jgi:hypothetical protein
VQSYTTKPENETIWESHRRYIDVQYVVRGSERMGWLPIERLSSDARLLIDDPDNELVFSTASIWEVAVKYGRGRDDFKADPRLLRRGLLDNLYRELTSHPMVAMVL